MKGKYLFFLYNKKTR